jgi:transposase
MIELAWIWIRLQPNSKRTQWFRKRFGDGGKRARRRGIVALSRMLLVDLWHFVEHGVVPPGAELKSAA